MLKAFKYRLYPTKDQAILLNKHIGCVRLVYNLAYDTKTMAYGSTNRISINKYDLLNELPLLKKENVWMKEINSQSIQASIGDLDVAFKNFFSGKAKFPNRKSKKKSKQSFRVPQHISIDNDKLFIPKFKEGIKMVIHRTYKGTIRNVTISRTPTGKYYASVLCDTKEATVKKPKVDKKTSLGIDLGLSHLAITSKGDKIENPRYLRKLEKKLKYYQRRYSKFKGKKILIKVRRLHEKVANQRKDHLHKLSSKLVSENQTICIEDLNIVGMLKNHKLAKSISDASWGMFIEMLKYKCEWYGVNLLNADRFDATTKTCTKCKNKNNNLTLKDRSWICPICFTEHDRDITASVNTKEMAIDRYYLVNK